MTRIPEGTAPSILNKSFRVTADVDIPASGAEGVLITQGGRFNGWGLYLLEGKPVFHYNLVGVQRYTVAGPDKLSAGKHTVVVDFKYDGGGLGKGGVATLSVDGKKAATASSKGPFPSAFQRMKPSTSARTLARRSVRITTCPSSSPAPFAVSTFFLAMKK